MFATERLFFRASKEAKRIFLKERLGAEDSKAPERSKRHD